MEPDLDEIESFDAVGFRHAILNISKLQVSLRLRSRTLQTNLEQLRTQADISSPEGAVEFLKQTATLLLDYSPFWTHVLATSSGPLSAREVASEIFNAFLRQEQDRTNTRAKVGASATTSMNFDETPQYVVVTLLLCTTGDRPLFEEIYSASLLRDVLQDITMARATDLVAFELVCNPPGMVESLKDEDLNAVYGDMVAIA